MIIQEVLKGISGISDADVNRMFATGSFATGGETLELFLPQRFRSG